MNAQMFNSFLDGTKSAIEMAAVSNATGLLPASDGLQFPPCGVDDLARVLRPRSSGGVLAHRGQVEVISSLERDGRPVFRDLRWGVDASVWPVTASMCAAALKEYGLVTDPFWRVHLDVQALSFDRPRVRYKYRIGGFACRTLLGADRWDNGDVVATGKSVIARSANA
jgi:hypothetical protein